MGRGKYHRLNAKISTADLLCVRLAEFKKSKCFTSGQSYSWQWSRNGERVASIGFTITDSFIRFMYSIKGGENNLLHVNKIIPLTFTSCNFGGQRKWFLCDCGRKVATMYISGQKIACRHCFNAVYPCQREDAIDRKWRKIYKLEARLNKSENDHVFWLDDRYKPKGMHWRTYKRIRNEWRTAHIKKYELIDLALSHHCPEIELLASM